MEKCRARHRAHRRRDGLLYSFGGADTELDRILRSSRAAALLMALLATVTAPVMEEVVYRGLLYSALQRLTGAIGAVALVTLIFAGLHVWQYWPNFAAISAILLLSLVLTVVRARTGRLLPCYMIHLVFNGVQSVIIVAEPYLRSVIETLSPKRARHHPFPNAIPLMECDVIVVGAGIGGLTTAALLAARGVDVCVFERQSQVGGCVANFEHLGYTFEPTCGLYSGWEARGTWERIFSQLPVSAPGVTKLSPNYVVRLPDGRDVQVSSDHSALENEIASVFTDCADAAIRFLREVRFGAPNAAVPAELLDGTSRHFRWFIDAQLQTFTQCTSKGCSMAHATAALRLATGDLWSIESTAQTLGDRLSKKSESERRIAATEFTCSALVLRD